MIWWAQLILAMVSAAGFFLLLGSYRRQDAQISIFLISLMVGLSALIIPDSLLYIPAVWWCVFMLRSGNAKTYIASVLGLMVVGIYTFLACYLLPDSAWVNYVLDIWTNLADRQIGVFVLPLWESILSLVLGLLGLVYMVAHYNRFSSANVRIQTHTLLVTPFFWLSLLSVLFPPAYGDCMLATFWISSVYLCVLYLITYGLPKFSLRNMHSAYPSGRSFSRRPRRTKGPKPMPRGMRPSKGLFRRR